eukprot:4475044-Pleurochrysis_carterae.AAC.1
MGSCGRDCAWRDSESDGTMYSLVSSRSEHRTWWVCDFGLHASSSARRSSQPLQAMRPNRLTCGVVPCFSAICSALLSARRRMRQAAERAGQVGAVGRGACVSERLRGLRGWRD